MKKTETHAENPHLDLSQMKALWQKQGQALQGHTLITDEDIHRAMDGNTHPAAHPVHWWRRVAAVAIVLIGSAAAVWLWSAHPAAPGNPSLSGTVAEAKPQPQPVPVAAPAVAPSPAAPSHPAPTATTKTATPSPLPSLQAPAPPASPLMPPQSPAPTDTPAHHQPPISPAAQWQETFVAQAAPPRHTPLPNRQRVADTITVHTTRLVQYDTPKRKSLTETIFEPVLASL